MTPDVVIDGEYSTQGWNRFSYVHNNPVVYKDPTGHNVFSDVWAGMKERAGTYANMGSAIKNAATNPGQFAKVVKQKVADKLHYYKDNKTQLLKDYGSAVAAPFKQLSGYNLIKGTEDIVRSNNPAKALGGKIVDAGVNVALNAAGAGIGKVVGSAAKGLGKLKFVKHGLFTSKDMALGLHGLERLTKFKGNALIGSAVKLKQGEELMNGIIRGMKETVEKGGKLRFSLKDFDIKQAFKRGSQNYNSYTSQEIREIFSDKSLLKNTVFYNDKGKVLKESIVHDMAGIK